MGRLAQAGVSVFHLYGNHDAESQITRRLSLPENVNVFSARKPQTFTLDGYDVALHGQSFKQRDITENLVPAYPAPVSGAFNIGVLHTGLGGMGGHANYAPCTLDDLVNKGYQYWALAHVHQAAILRENPHVVFCGNLQGRLIKETGAKTAYLVSVEKGEIDEISPLGAGVVRWHLLSVPIDGCAGLGDVIDRIRVGIEGAVADETEGRLLACRIELTGKSQLHGQLIASTEHLLAECRAVVLAHGDEVAWIERIVILSEPQDSPGAAALRKDALGDLQSFLAHAGSDSALLEQLESEFGDLIRKLPHEARSEIDDPFLKENDPKWAKKGLFVMLMLDENLARVNTCLDLDSLRLTVRQGNQQVAAAQLADQADRTKIEHFFWQLLPTLPAAPALVRSAGGHFMDKPDNVISLINLATVRTLEAQWGVELDPLRFRANI